MLGGLLVMSVATIAGGRIQTQRSMPLSRPAGPEDQLMRYNGINATMQYYCSLLQAPAAAGVVCNQRIENDAYDERIVTAILERAYCPAGTSKQNIPLEKPASFLT